MNAKQDIAEQTARYLADPVAVYDELRQTGPVHQVTHNGLNVWMITDYEQARQALADPTLCKGNEGALAIFTRQAEERGLEPLTFVDGIGDHMLNTDPPDHTRLRKLITRAFTLRAVQRLEPKIEEITARLLDSLAEQFGSGASEVDLLTAFAFPLPLTVICELLGVPEADRNQFGGWTAILLSSRPEDGPLQVGAAEDMAAFLSGLIADKRAHPAEDLLSALIETAEDGDRLGESELIAMVFLLLIAGHETTVNLIGNGMLALFRNPDQRAKLSADNSLLPAAIEEFLRYEGPLNTATLRYTTTPLTIGGVTIDAGELIVVSPLAANRDPLRFQEPDKLDIGRQTSGHLAFGHGIHFCVGAPLARMEGRIAIRELLARFPDLELAREPGELEWRASQLMRGMVELPVRLG